ncbi:MAG: PHP domain-containing protein [Acidimicrobiales bacterium]
MIDLHTHSSVSDGSDPPERIPELAAGAGCVAVALTDHDRLDGLPRAAARAAELGVEFVPGVEVSCDVPSGTMHLLVYWVEEGEGPLQQALRGLQDERSDRNRRMVERFAALGLPVSEAELRDQAGGDGVGRPHAAAILVRKGVVDSVQEAFDVWLAKGRPAYVEKGRLLPAEAIGLARSTGGVPVLAHPLSLDLPPGELESRIGEWKAMGLCGLEATYGRYSPEDRVGLVELAGRTDLVATGGSDYHGTYKPDLRVGVGRGDLDVDDNALTLLTARRTA